MGFLSVQCPLRTGRMGVPTVDRMNLRRTALLGSAATLTAVAAFAIFGGAGNAMASILALHQTASTPTPTTPAAGSAATSGPAVGGVISDDTTLVTIGDSIMAGHGLADAATGAWPVLLGTATGDHVVNDSCSGAGFIAVGSCGNDYQGLIAEAVAADPGIVIIESSDNDNGEDPTTLATATTETVAALHAAVPTARIVGLSTLWDQPGAVPAEVEQSSDDLRTAVTAVGGTYLDIGQPIAGKDGLLQADDEHPTDAGQQVLASAILADLRAAGIAN